MPEREPDKPENPKHYNLTEVLMWRTYISIRRGYYGCRYNKLHFFFVIAVLSNYFLSFYLRKYLLAAVISATLSTVVFQVIGYLIMGYLDPFFLIALILGWIVAFIVGLLVGLPFLIKQRKTD